MSGIESLDPSQAQRLTELQLQLECIAVESGNRLARIPCSNPDDIPRVLVVKHDDTFRLYGRYDLPAGVWEGLVALPPRQAFEDAGSVQRILSRDTPCVDHTMFKGYVFPPMLAPELYPEAGRLCETNKIGRPVFGIVVDGRVVSACESVRENDVCAEAWVWTLPQFRRQGYARQVTAAWAHDLQHQGKIPFYSHKLENAASESVARRLGLIPFATAVAHA